jgi:hypothetical protein
MPAPPRQPPGWYPDPGQRGMLRYWTGVTWTNRTAPMRPAPPLPPMPAAAPYAPPASAPPAGPARRGWGCLTSLGLGGLALLFAVVMAVVALSRGQEVKSVDAGGKIEFYSAKGGEYSADEIAGRQDALEKELAEVKEQAESRAGSSTNVAPPPVDLTGTWQGDDGVAQYDLQQFGTYVVVQERTAYGITAVGQGTFDGRHLELSYQAFNYTTGQASLDLVDGRTLSGYFNNSMYGQSPATLRR